MKEQIAIGISLRPDGSIYVHGMDSKDVVDWTREHGRSLAIQLVNMKNGRVEANMFMAPKPTPILLDESETARIVEECAKRREQARTDLAKTHSDLIESETARHYEKNHRNIKAMLNEEAQPLRNRMNMGLHLNNFERMRLERIENFLNTPVSEVMAKVEPPIDRMRCNCEYCKWTRMTPQEKYNAAITVPSAPHVTQESPEMFIGYMEDQGLGVLGGNMEPPAMDLPEVVGSGDMLDKSPDWQLVESHSISGTTPGGGEIRCDPPQELEPPKRVNWKEFL